MNEQLRKAIELKTSLPPYGQPHEAWCDTENSISKRCNCMASSYLDALEDAKESQAKLLRVIELLVQQRDDLYELFDVVAPKLSQLDAELIAALEEQQ